MPRQRLDLLPSEIIQHIIALGPPSNALAGRSVCRRLNTICSDAAIYLSIIRRSNCITSTVGTEVFTVWPGFQRLERGQDWRICARYALANMYLDSHAFGGPLDHVHFTFLCRSTWKWLPELIATGHKPATENGVKIIRSSRSNHFLNQVEQVVRNSLTWSTNREHHNEIAVRLIFISVCDSFRNAACAKRDHAQQEIRRDQKLLYFYYPSPFTFLVEAFLPMIQLQYDDAENSLFKMFSPTMEQTNVMSTWLTKADQDLHWSRCMMLCMVMSAVLYDCVLRSQGGANSLTTSGLTFDAFLGLPPTPIDIPFNDMYQIDPPFSMLSHSLGLSGFATKHLSGTTSAAFLEDGEWCGYCFSDSIDTIENWAVHGLSLKVTSDCADHCTITGDCKRLMSGRMSLSGTIFKKTGWSQLDAHIDIAGGLGTLSPWSVMMTPFGIIGSWKFSNVGSDRGGWLWLWKKAWQSASVDPVWRYPPTP